MFPHLWRGVELKYSEKEKDKMLTDIESRINNENSFTEEDILFFRELKNDRLTFYRIEVARLLIDATTKEGIDLLKELARDKNYLVRVEACDSLGSFATEENKKMLQEILLSDTHFLVRGYALMSFGDICKSLEQEVYGKEVLLYGLEKERSTFVKVNYYTYLYMFEEENYLTLLVKQIKSKKDNIRCCVVKSLGEIANKDNKDYIIDLLQSHRSIESSDAIISTIDKVIGNI